jgi:hypothetical protein
VLNTIRQTGSALGGAIVLAVLQNRLAAQLSYVGAMRVAIAVPVVALLAGALLCLALRPPRRPAQSGQAANAGAGAADRSAPVEAAAERNRQSAANPSPM